MASDQSPQLVAVRIKTGAHLGEIREMNRDTALELVPLGRVEIVPWELYQAELRERRLRRMLGLPISAEAPADQQPPQPADDSLFSKIVSKLRT